MFKAAVGHGIDPDSMGAVEEALEQCQKTLAGEIPQAGIVIAAIDFEHEEILRRIRERYPDITLVGGTSVGEMSSELAFQEDSLTLMLFCSDEVIFQAGVGRQADKDAIAAAKCAIAQATSAAEISKLKLCYVLGDGLGVDAVAMVEGLKEATDDRVPIVGGLTADDWGFKKTYQFISTPAETAVLQASVVVLSLSGNLKVSYSVSSGQVPIGPKAIATKSQGNVLYEIDERPAKDFYTNTLGVPNVRLAGGGAWGGSIAVYEADGTNFYVRSPSSEGNPDGSIDYFGHISEQSTIQLTEATNESLLGSAREAFQAARLAYPGEAPAAALMISCASRMKALGTCVEQEYALAAEFLGTELPNMGFYAFGEISPFTNKTTPHFHNETFTALLIGTC